MRIPKVFNTVADLRKWNAAQRKLGNSIGLVPTMGALHAGHIALLRQSMSENQASVTSIFVNPSQFAPNEDLTKYPRTMDSDLEKIAKLCEEFPQNELVVFAPSVNEMYPSGITLHREKQVGTFVEVLGFSHQLEGSIRPHFFRGVATVVSKLLHAALPDVAYFGQKDMQQCAVVKRMVSDLLFPVKISLSEIAREPNGLAMSSRNEYLAPEARTRASIIYKSLAAAKKDFSEGEKDPAKLMGAMRSILTSEPLITDIEYISLNDPDTLEELKEARKGSVISLAVGVNDKNGKRMRLIDNIFL